MIKIDVVIGLQYGDEGKGKVCHSLLEKGGYTHVLRFNGGGNAGHTIYHNGEKLVTHLVPSGVFFGIKSIIGAGCVLNVDKFFEEISYLEERGFDTKGVVFIARNAHVVTSDHIAEDSKESVIGTTGSGNGPAYRDKSSRKGIRACDVPALKPWIIDMYDEFYSQERECHILAEGAQAFGLDLDWGDYPYVTSSSCGVGALIQNGFNHNQIGKVYGIIKAYETYVGAKKFQGSDPVFDLIQAKGKEFGATTGRKRQCNWLDWDLVSRAVRTQGVDKVIINKADILKDIGRWSVKSFNGVEISFNDECSFKEWLTENLTKLGCKEVQFSYSPYDI